MVWALLAIATVAFLIVSPGFRVFALIVAGVAVLAVLWMFHVDSQRHEEWQRQQQAAARAEAA